MKEEGFIGVPQEIGELVGKTGMAITILKPSGKVSIEGKTYDAMSEIGYLDSGTQVLVKRYEAGQVYVTALKKD
jgi:membrane-bound serine protease (ClpP class)